MDGLAKRGDMGPMMWIAIGVLVIIAVIIVIISLKSKSFGLLDSLGGL